MTRPAEHPRWLPTQALRRAVAVGGALLLIAVLFRRPDSVVVATPVLVATALGLLRAPRGAVSVALRTSASSMLEGQLMTVSVDVSSDDDLDVATVALPPARFLPPWQARRARSAAVAASRPASIDLDVRSVRWGRRPVGPATVRLTGADCLLHTPVLHTGAVSSTTLPLRDGFEAVDAVPRAEGLVGPHRSRRVGDGTDVAGVRPFQLGDRLHRINWAVSLRAGGLHVTSTYSDRDTEVVIVIDSSSDFGVSGGIDGDPTSLDLAVRAAASIAEHYLRHGDRVGLLDLGQAVRRVPSGAGRAHLVRLLDVLLDVTATQRSIGIRAAIAGIAPNALVLMLSPLVTDAASSRAIELALGGHTVLLIDTLPPGARPPGRSEWTDLAWRLWLLERDVDAGRLAEFGIPVVRWEGAGTLDQVLRDVSRAAGAPRARR
ncbi:MAG: DUF58 domain-containing protein [Mycobacteriales bacterium]